MFKPGSKVLAYHGPLIYEAKVLKVHESGKNYITDNQDNHEPLNEEFPANLMDYNCGLLHYKGWKLKWDEWVTQDRILFYNSDNWELSKRLRSDYNLKMRHKTPPSETSTASGTTVGGNGTGTTGSGSGPGSSSGGGGVGGSNSSMNAYNSVMKGIKRRLGDDKPKKGKDLILPLSNELQSILIDDWEFITKDHKIITVPVNKPVKLILSDYINYESKIKSNSELMIIKEVINGLENYFNQTVKLFLLYKYERLQYSNYLKDVNKERKRFQDQQQQQINNDDNEDFELFEEQELSEVYGLEHLLRLLITLPGLISNTSMDSPSINKLLESCGLLTKYLSITFNDYINDYDSTTPAYDNLARS